MREVIEFIFIVFIIGAVCLGLAIVGSLLNVVTIPWLRFDSKVQMNRDIITDTYSATNAIYNYHWFKERAGDITTASQSIETASSSLASFEASAGPRKDWTFEDKTEDARLRAVLQGNITYYNSLVNEYDARAKEADRAIFQDNLPLFFNLK